MTFEWQSYDWGMERVKLSRQNKLFLCHFLALAAWCVTMFYVNRNKFHHKTDEHNKHMVIIARQGWGWVTKKTVSIAEKGKYLFVIAQI